MSDYSMSAYDLANALYDKSDAVGIPLHQRSVTLIAAWVREAQRQIATGTVSMDDISAAVAH
jgi:hypothetical protein